MNETSASSAAAAELARRVLVTDACRVLALAALAVLGPALHLLAAGRLVRHGWRQWPGPTHFLLLHATLAGLIFSCLHGLPLAQWAAGASPLSEAACRLGRAAADALYATQSALLTAAVLSLLRRPGAYLLTLVLTLIWLLGLALNFGHVHWRAAAGAADANFAAGDFVETGGVADDVADDVADVAADVAAAYAGCAAEERRMPLLLQSRGQAALAAAPLLLALLLLLCRRPAAPLLPLLAVLAAVRSTSCLGQLLVLLLAAGQPGLLDGTAGVLRDAGVLLEAALLLVMFRPGPEPVQAQDQYTSITPAQGGESLLARTGPTGYAAKSAPVLWPRPKMGRDTCSYSEPWR